LLPAEIVVKKEPHPSEEHVEEEEEEDDYDRSLKLVDNQIPERKSLFEER
jgi:hypothetical protein